MVTELMGWSRIIGFQDYGHLWRSHRRLFHQDFNEIEARKYRHRQEKAAHLLVSRLRKSPAHWYKHLQ